MNEFQRGVWLGLQMAVDAEMELRKSMAHFATVEEWKGYKNGVLSYKARIERLRDAKSE